MPNCYVSTETRAKMLHLYEVEGLTPLLLQERFRLGRNAVRQNLRKAKLERAAELRLAKRTKPVPLGI